MKNISYLAAIMFIGCSPCMAQQCDTILTKGLRDYEITSDSSSYLNATFSEYCHQSGETRESSTNFGLDAVVKALPVKFTLGSTDNRTKLENFCKTYKDSTEFKSNKNAYRETIVSKAYDSYVSCVQLTQLGLFVTHDLLSQEKSQILLRAGVGKPIEINGLDASSNISCYGSNKGQEIKYTPSTHASSDTNIGVFCTRTSRDGEGGIKVYDEGTVAIDITGSKYNFYWPKSVEIPEKLASQVQTSILELRNGINIINEQITKNRSVIEDGQSTDVKADGDLRGQNAIWMKSSCPAGQVVKGVNLHLGGTARGALDRDGRPVSTFYVVCSQLKAIK